MNTRSWLISVIAYYRHLDFFRQYSNLSHIQIANILEKIQKENNFCNGKFDARREEDVIALDEDRIVPICLEEIYCDSFDFQSWRVRTLKSLDAYDIVTNILWELSEISRGIFKIKNIQCLSYEENIVSVQFTWNNNEYTISLEAIDDLSLAVLKLNPILKNTKYQFEVWNLIDEQFILMLTYQEKQKLQKEKKWIFDDSNSDYDELNSQKYSHPLVTKIYDLAESVCLGSESSDPVQIYLTKAKSYEAAGKEVFNPNNAISRATLKEFKEFYLDEYNKNLENMILEFEKLNAVYGQVVPEEYIGSIEEHGVRGHFFICFFIKTIENVGNNIFIAFPRYEGY